MYWVIGLFDEKTEQTIKNIWEELSDSEISFYGEEIKDSKPHLTLASYYELDKNEYMRLLDKFYSHKAGVDITFNTLGSFLNYRTLFLSPTMTKELMEFHFQHHAYFKNFSSHANTYYSPGQWIPHCTLANKLSTEKLSQAFNFCLERHQTIHGRITEIALIELIGENDERVEAPIIYSQRLNLI